MALGRIALAISYVILSITPAMPYCYEPSFSQSPPDAPSRYKKPDVPFCLSSYSYSGEHTCDTWELDAYKEEVSDFIDSLNDYLSEAVSFAENAQGFASEVETYAKCEAKEVSQQHE